MEAVHCLFTENAEPLIGSLYDTLRMYLVNSALSALSNVRSVTSSYRMTNKAGMKEQNLICSSHYTVILCV